MLAQEHDKSFVDKSFVINLQQHQSLFIALSVCHGLAESCTQSLKSKVCVPEAFLSAGAEGFRACGQKLSIWSE